VNSGWHQSIEGLIGGYSSGSHCLDVLGIYSCGVSTVKEMLLHDAEELLLQGCDAILFESVSGRGKVKGIVGAYTVVFQKQVSVVSKDWEEVSKEAIIAPTSSPPPPKTTDRVQCKTRSRAEEVMLIHVGQLVRRTVPKLSSKQRNRNAGTYSRAW
jgi:hypothetical protein